MDMRGRRARWAVLVAVLSLGCSHPPPDATPEGAVRLFLDQMEAAGDDRRVVRQVYDLLGPVSRANLSERARRAKLLQGRQVEPWDMLAAGRFGLLFRPKTMRSKIVGDRATVEVTGADPQGEHATVDCVRVAASWKVEPGFPGP
ncbi:MAG: hypothetical protein ABTD50_18475 [Polyangiaceae bacterium]